MTTTKGNSMSIAFNISLNGLGLITITTECKPDNLDDTLVNIFTSLSSYTTRHAALIKEDKTICEETSDAN